MRHLQWNNEDYDCWRLEEPSEPEEPFIEPRRVQLKGRLRRNDTTTRRDQSGFERNGINSTAGPVRQRLVPSQAAPFSAPATNTPRPPPIPPSPLLPSPDPLAPSSTPHPSPPPSPVRPDEPPAATAATEPHHNAENTRGRGRGRGRPRNQGTGGPTARGGLNNTPGESTALIQRGRPRGRPRGGRAGRGGRVDTPIYAEIAGMMMAGSLGGGYS